MSKLLAVNVLMFSKPPSTFSVIYYEKSAYLAKLLSCVQSVPGPLFGLPLIAKICAGDKAAP